MENFAVFHKLFKLFESSDLCAAFKEDFGLSDGRLIDGKKDMIKMLHVSVPHLKIEKYRQYDTDNIRHSCSHFNQTDQNQPEMTSMHRHFASKTVT